MTFIYNTIVSTYILFLFLIRFNKSVLIIPRINNARILLRLILKTIKMELLSNAHFTHIKSLCVTIIKCVCFHRASVRTNYGMLPAGNSFEYEHGYNKTIRTKKELKSNTTIGH